MVALTDPGGGGLGVTQRKAKTSKTMYLVRCGQVATPLKKMLDSQMGSERFHSIMLVYIMIILTECVFGITVENDSFEFDEHFRKLVSSGISGTTSS